MVQIRYMYLSNYFWTHECITTVGSKKLKICSKKGEGGGVQGFLRDSLQDNEDTSKLIGSGGSILHQPLQINGNHLILMSTDFTCEMVVTVPTLFTTATCHPIV